MDLKDLKIDPEFEEKIPPLTEDEFSLLEQNIVTDGEVLDPLIIWNNTILDGHNRYRILKKHPEIPFKTFPKEFPDNYHQNNRNGCHDIGFQQEVIHCRGSHSEQPPPFHDAHTFKQASGILFRVLSESALRQSSFSGAAHTYQRFAYLHLIETPHIFQQRLP